jgi:Zn-dependent peptidase ImmA (M78 family)
MNRIKIKAFIDALLERHQIESYPVDLDKWIEIAGAQIKVADFGKDLSGFAYQKKGVKIIGVSNSEPEERKRFTIAHELGHMFLHKGTAVNYDEASMMLRPSTHVGAGLDLREIEANSFAAELLMPEENIRADVEKHERFDLEDENAVAQLAKKYKVSVPAMTIRLNSLYFAE